MKAPINKYVLVLIWILLYLAIIDIIVNISFRYPLNPEKTPPSFLQGYFEYGRSVEGKFDRKINARHKQAIPSADAWIRSKYYESLPGKVNEDKVLIAIYGMSHTKLLGEAIARINKKYVVRNITGPGSPPGWSLAAYRNDKNLHEAKVVILGIMTEHVAQVSATSFATSFFDGSYPYTFPRYIYRNRQLQEIYPPFYTDEGFKVYFSDSHKWAEYRDWLYKNDRFYNYLLFRRSIADMSAILRILRRAYSEHFNNNVVSSVYTNKGFNLNSEEVITLQEMVKAFAEEVRKQNRIPIIYIVNNQTRADHLYKALRPVLAANKIPFLSTHEICPPDDPRVFVDASSHFTESKDIELAKAMIKIIEDNLYNRYTDR